MTNYPIRLRPSSLFPTSSLRNHAMSLRVGIIGAGGIAAKLHLPELVAVPGVEVTVLAGRKQSRLDTLCRKFNVPRSSNSYEEVIADPNIDAVVIALPHPLHVKYGLMALDAGKHVHMQKPLSTSLDEAEQFVQAAGKTDKTVLCLPYVARPALLAARDCVARGELGRISAAHARFSHGGPEVYYATIQQILEEEDEDDLWFFDAKRADVGALFDMGVYAIAHLVTLLGTAKSVVGRCTTVDKPTTLEDTAAMILEFAGGTLGVAETGWCDGARTYGFEVHGTKGKLVNPPLTPHLLKFRPSTLVDEDGGLIQDAVDCSKYSSVDSHQHWIDCIRERKQPPFSNARYARHITEIMLAGLESSKSGKVTPIRSSV